MASQDRLDLRPTSDRPPDLPGGRGARRLDEPFLFAALIELRGEPVGRVGEEVLKGRRGARGGSGGRFETIYPSPLYTPLLFHQYKDGRGRNTPFYLHYLRYLHPPHRYRDCGEEVRVEVRTRFTSTLTSSAAGIVPAVAPLRDDEVRTLLVVLALDLYPEGAAQPPSLSLASAKTHSTSFVPMSSLSAPLPHDTSGSLEYV